MDLTIARLELSGSRFRSDFSAFLNNTKSSSYRNCTFDGRVQIVGIRRQHFKSAVGIVGQDRNNSGSYAEYGRAITGSSDFQNVIFVRPASARIERADFSTTDTRGTSLRGVSLQAINWCKLTSTRIGLFSEALIEKSDDAVMKAGDTPALEEQYRQVRQTLEESKRFGEAGAFYEGEMEAKRRQLGPLRKHFGILGAYRLCSRYGTSVKRSTTVFVSIIVVYAFIGYLTEENTNITGLDCLLITRENIFSSWSIYLKNLVNSFEILTFRKAGYVLEGGPGFKLIDIFFRVMASVQFFLVIFALRNLVRRF